MPVINAWNAHMFDFKRLYFNTTYKLDKFEGVYKEINEGNILRCNIV